MHELQPWLPAQVIGRAALDIACTSEGRAGVSAFEKAHTFVCPSNWDERRAWKGRPEEVMMSNCNRVVPFASTTLTVSYTDGVTYTSKLRLSRAMPSTASGHAVISSSVWCYTHRPVYARRRPIFPSSRRRTRPGRCPFRQADDRVLFRGRYQYPDFALLDERTLECNRRSLPANPWRVALNLVLRPFSLSTWRSRLQCASPHMFPSNRMLVTLHPAAPLVTGSPSCNGIEIS